MDFRPTFPCLVHKLSVILTALELIINSTEKWAKIQNIFDLSDKFDGDTSFGEVMQTLSDDTLQLLNTKAKIVQFVGKSSAKAALG